MRRNILLAGAALAAVFAQAGRAATVTPAFGFDVNGMDRSVPAGDNFFRYANGRAVDALVIPPDHSSWGEFNRLHDLSESRTHDILEHASTTGNDAVAKAGRFYRAFLDEAMAEKRGATPLGPDMARVRAVANAHDFAALCGLAQKSFLGSIVDLGIIPDPKDPTQYAITVSQDGLGLPDRDTYLNPADAKIRADYTPFVEHMLTLAGWPTAHADAPKVVAFETEIAKVSWSRADRRDDDKTYNPISFADLQKQAPGFDWAAFFGAADLGQPPRVILNEKSAIEAIAQLVARTPVDTLRAWAAFHLAANAAPVLSHDFVDANFAFYGTKLEGQPQNKVRWKRAVGATNSAMGEAVGQAYVAKYYPPDARAQMQVLTDRLRQAFHDRLEHNDWMAPQTRQKALEKLAAFDFQIGYPKKWRDYSGLDVRADDAYGNAERASAFDWAFWIGHLGHKVDRDQWEMYPQTVNAYNEPLMNEVVFPAAILQPPFFDPKADPAINYGGIGGVIGHEMTHSFDDQGRKHDAHGRLANWWTPEDVKRFDERAKRYGAQFAAMNILPGARINPELTMGENIADLGGLTLALDAYHASLGGKPAPVIDGFTGDQRVFLGWAQVWRAKLREAAERQLLVVDPHSPPIARVNGPAHNIDAWYKAFDVKPGETLYLKPADRVKIW